MSAHASSVETEIKLRLGDAAKGRALVRRAGLRLSRRRTFERNVVFDTPGSDLRRQGALLRLRECGGRKTLTYKGSSSPGRHKSREEVEVTFSDLRAMTHILNKLGYEVMFQYEKYRTEYTDGEGVVMVDETPIGAFLELEGSGEWIDRMAERLGYGAGEYETRSYGSLFQQYSRELGSPQRNMVFPEQGKGRSPSKVVPGTRKKTP
jgi:adenylate cyclase, class 2